MQLETKPTRRVIENVPGDKRNIPIKVNYVGQYAILDMGEYCIWLTELELRDISSGILFKDQTWNDAISKAPETHLVSWWAKLRSGVWPPELAGKPIGFDSLPMRSDSGDIGSDKSSYVAPIIQMIERKVTREKCREAVIRKIDWIDRDQLLGMYGEEQPHVD